MGGRFERPGSGEAYEWPLASGVEERFWAKVDVREDDECWEWKAYCNRQGYGMIRNGRRMAKSSRMAWVLANHRPIPSGLHALHHCDNRACVNHSHIYVGTNADNIKDKVTRERSKFSHPERQGELHPLAKLSADDVREIRRVGIGGGKGRESAKRFGVSPATVTLIVQRKLWPHLP